MGYDTAIYVVDVLADGSVTPDSDTESGIYDSLAGAGFTLVPFADTAGLYGIDTQGFIGAIRRRGLTRARRVVFGIATLTSISIVDGVYLASADADIKVVDIETGKIVYTGTGSRTARGRTREAGITAVFRGLGEQLGNVLARELP